jgi:exopolyphosphatase/guanosine-5'-triphosphate,3'-diphosphate pyrophosphatase
VRSEVSVPIGAVRMTERHLKHDPPVADEVAALEADIDRHLAALTLPRGVPVIATAGAAIFARVVARVDAPALITCDRGIRWGVAYERMSTGR